MTTQTPAEQITEATSGLPADLATATPPQMDATLAALDAITQRLNYRADGYIETLHRVDGQERIIRWGSHDTWPLDARATEASVRAKLAAGTLPAWDQRSAERTLVSLDAVKADRAAAREAAAPLNAQWQERQWSRFWLVSNTNGHIHKHTACSTCRVTTRFGWLTDLSGLTEADAVAAHGPLLCTVCYPSAPLDWTVGLPPKVDPDACTGTSPVPGTVTRRYRSAHGKCAECQTTQVVTTTGRVRKHKRPAA